MTTSGIIIFVKNPEIGKAKTRIAATVGFEKSLEIYQELLGITATIAEDIDINRFLYYTHFINTADNWSNDKYEKFIQVDGGLGDKMSNAFETVLNSVQKAIIIGSDCPYLSSDLINEALIALDTHDVVIGPTFDGGYYLLGMNKYIPNLFTDIEFSTETVFEETTSKLNQLGSSYTTLTQLHDVDYYEDWVRYKESISA